MSARTVTWARYRARVGGLLRKPDDPLSGGLEAEAYDALSAGELRSLAEEKSGSGASGRVLHHLRIFEDLS